MFYKIVHKHSLLVLFNYLLLVRVVGAQPAVQPVSIQVTPSHADWTYKTGEEVVFNVLVLKGGHPLKGTTINYEVGWEKMPPLKKGSLQQTENRQSISAGKTATPGFIRCIVSVEADGVTYRNIGTAAVDPLKITPVAEMPDDFNQFWIAAREEAKKAPLDAKMTHLAARSSEKINVYEVSFRNGSADNRIHGILCVPKGAGKFPAALQVPGAGTRSYGGDAGTAEAGIITLQIGIHGIPVTMENGVYQNLAAGPLSEYWIFNLDDRDRYYYKRVYLGCLKAIDFLYSLPQFDSSTLAVYGGSQGGALSIVTAALDSRVKYLYSFYPALCDLTGYFHGRAGGWPHMFANNNAFNNKADKVATSRYYDVVNFARNLKVAGVYSFGYNDEVCPPTSMFAAYNSITAPKQLLIYEDSGHWTYPEQSKRMNAMMVSQLLQDNKRLQKE